MEKKIEEYLNSKQDEKVLTDYPNQILFARSYFHISENYIEITLKSGKLNFAKSAFKSEDLFINNLLKQFFIFDEPYPNNITPEITEKITIAKTALADQKKRMGDLPLNVQKWILDSFKKMD
jgi:hypothetical protein